MTSDADYEPPKTTYTRGNQTSVTQMMSHTWQSDRTAPSITGSLHLVCNFTIANVSESEANSEGESREE